MAGLSNSFAPILNNTFTRKWAGNSASAVDPYISGYFFIHFAYLPVGLGVTVPIPKGRDGVSGTADIQKILRSSCLAVTMPGATVNKAEFTGLGGIKWAVPTNVDWDNTVTLRFLEFSSIPIFSIISGWVRLMRDYRTGVARTLGDGIDTYTKSAYAASMYYWTTKPDGKTLEYYALLSGMFPMKDPTDQYGGDLATYDKLELDIDFNVDYIWRESWVKDRIAQIAGYDEGTKTAEGYGEIDNK